MGAVESHISQKTSEMWGTRALILRIEMGSADGASPVTQTSGLISCNWHEIAEL